MNSNWPQDKRISGTTLQNIRKIHFERYPLCVRCLDKIPPVTRIAIELDHVVPLHKGGIESRDPFVNRAGLCAACHLEKSKTERGHEYKPKVRIGLDGFPVEQ